MAFEGEHGQTIPKSVFHGKRMKERLEENFRFLGAMISIRPRSGFPTGEELETLRSTLDV